MSQVSEVNEYILQSTPLPAHDVMPDKETCEFKFQIDILNLQMEKIRKKLMSDLSWSMYPPPESDFFLSEVRFELASVPSPQNQKKFFYLKLDLSWPMYPPPIRIKKLFFIQSEI